MRRFKNVLIVSFLLIIFLILSINSYVNAVFQDLSSSVLRLHVIANSDSYEDQALKLQVRDKLLEYMSSMSSDISTKEGVLSFVQVHLYEFEQVAKKVVDGCGYDYDVRVSLGKSDFPTKSYGDMTFPAGTYDALKVQIGNSNGQNWWCVMFPPLCFVNITSAELPDESKESLKENLSDEDYSIITESKNSCEFKFKIIEVLNRLKQKVGNNSK